MSDQHDEVQRTLSLSDEEEQTPPTEDEIQAFVSEGPGLSHDEYLRIRALPPDVQNAAIYRLTVQQLRDYVRYDSREWPAPMKMTAFHRPSDYVSRQKMVPKPTPQELEAMVRRLNDQGF